MDRYLLVLARQDKFRLVVLPLRVSAAVARRSDRVDPAHPFGWPIAARAGFSLGYFPVRAGVHRFSTGLSAALFAVR